MTGRFAGPAAALAVLLVIVGCGGDNESGADRDGRPPFLAFGFSEEARFMVFFAGPDTARLVTPEGIRTMTRILSASGARYAAGTDTLWTKGDEMMLIRGTTILRRGVATGRQRVLEDLWRRGALFTAAGNEPFWSLTVWPDSLVLIEDMGAQVRRHALAEAAAWSETEGFVDHEADIMVTVESGPCLDTMSGAPFPRGVSVRWGGRDYRGCGVPLGPRF